MPGPEMLGPTFVKNARKEVRGISWQFNAWGGEVDGLYASWEKDDAAAEAVCDALGYPVYDAGDFVLEAVPFTVTEKERC